jgi:UMF1 family MFS transporter
LLRRPVVAWALCDWANSAFATTVMAGFFPVFFKQYWSAGTEASVSTFQLGVANSAGSLVIALLAPLLGAMADRGGAGRRKRACITHQGAQVYRRLQPRGQGERRAGAPRYQHAGSGL